MRDLLGRVHWPLVGVAAILCTIGLVFVSSATGGSGLYDGYARRQALWAVMAALACAFSFLVGHRKALAWAPWLLGGSVLLLGLVLVAGTEAKGARRWLPFGPVRLQPSELAKITLVLALARLLAVPGRGRSMTGFGQALATTGVVMGPILLQPDLGTALVLLPVVLAMAVVAGTRWRWLGGIVLVGLLMLPVAYQWGLADYQRDRIRAFLSPEAYAQEEGYQSIQAFVAVGDGGLTGRGLGQGSQSRLDFLPDRHTDFIFCVVAEEWGFVGAVAVLWLHGLLALLILEVAARARDRPSALLAAGLGTLIFAQVVVNVGMAIGLAPVTGLPLPLLSYGGTALVATGLALGLVLSVHAEA